MDRGIGSFHPLISFSYFFIVISISMFYMHPVFILISLTSGIVYSLMLNKYKTISILKYSILLIVGITLVNTVFVNRGMTILFFFRGNPITLESFLYGLTSGFMMLSIIIWFNCYNEIITSDKFLYIFGKVMPSIALMISMTLRLIPKLIRQGKEIINSQKSIGIDVEDKKIINKIKSSMRVLSVLVTWALEDIIITADSMKSRGYGVRNRTNFSIYRFIERDFFMLSIIAICSIFIITSYFYGYATLAFYPVISNIKLDNLGITVYILFFILTSIPIILEIMEVYKWKSLD